MNQAIKLAKEICRKITAVNKTKSETLKRDYNKSISNDIDELSYYCECLQIDVKEVFNRVVKGI